MASYYGPDPDDPRRYGTLPVNEGYVYHHRRYSPDWLYDPYRLSMADKQQPVQAIAYAQAYDNAGYYSTSSLKKTGGYNLGSEGEDRDFTRRTSRRRCYIVLAIVLVTLLLLAALVLGLYFGVIDKPDSSRSDATTTTIVQPSSTSQSASTAQTTTSKPTSQPDTKVSYEVILTLDDIYSSYLDDPGTSEYVELKNNIETLINTILQDSDLSEWYTGNIVTGFRRGSRLAIVKIDFSSRIVRYDNQDRLLDKTKVNTVVEIGLIARPAEVQRHKIKTAEIVVEVLPGTGSVDLGGVCSDVKDCSDRYTECSGSGSPMCKCIYGYYDGNTPDMLGGACNEKIPYDGTVCTEGRHCLTPNAICLNAKCICDPHRHYFKTDACVPKLGLNEQGCEETSQCAGEGIFCDSGVCVCHPVTHFIQNNQCVKKKGINESGCSINWHCAKEGSVCENDVCVCNPRTLYYTGIECAPKKLYGQVCNTDAQCTTLLCKDNVCGCQDEEYHDGSVCKPKKQNGEACLKDVECKVNNSFCDVVSKMCRCSEIMYQDGMVCHSKKGYDKPCAQSIECISPFECRESKCQCTGESFFDGYSCVVTTTTKSTTKTTTKETMTPTTTTKTTSKETMSPSTTETMTTTTTVPPAVEEIPIVELSGSVTSATQYDPELADPNSALHQNYSLAFKQAFEDGLKAEGKEGTITNVTFSEGSLIMSYTLKVSVEIVMAPTNRQEIQELQDRVVELIKPALTVVIAAITTKLDAPDFLKQIDVTEPVEVEPVPDPPCRNGEKMFDYAQYKVCGKILSHLRENPDEDTCGTYTSLLDCVSLMYVYDSESCRWNNMEVHFKQKAATALGLNKKKIKDCFPPGQKYSFKPVTAILADTPCMDVHLMIPVARYECRNSYNNMLMPARNLCSEGKMLSTCVLNRLRDHYQTCTVSSDYGITILVDYQSSFFPNQQLLLETCEYCLSPNLEHLLLTKCNSPLQFMTLWPWKSADCTNLQNMIKCVEAQTLKWTNTCTLDNIMYSMRGDSDRFFKHVEYVPAFQGSGFLQCIGEDIMNIGPAVTQDLCHNHNYIGHLFVYRCTQWERIDSEQIVDQCSELLQGVQCVVDLYTEEEYLQCDYNDTFSAVWEKNSNFPLSLVDVLTMSTYPGANCSEYYHSNTGQCQVSFFSSYEKVHKECIPDMDEDLERTLMNMSDIACGAFAETTRCAMRQLHNNYTCQLQDIEPALRASFFLKYAHHIKSSCPSQGYGPFEKEVICDEFDSLGARMLVSCGSFLMPSAASPVDPCSGVIDFGECALSENSMIVNICDRLKIARAFHSLADGLASDFNVTKKCFSEHPGVCKTEYQGNCTDIPDGGMPCLLDNKCDYLEKCCSNGCYMDCTTNIRDEDPNGVMLCPAVDTVYCSNPVDSCYVHGHCPGSSLCCSDGCQNVCTEAAMEKIYTSEDCRKEQIIKTALVVCSDNHTLSNSSCRSFSDMVDCVQDKLDAVSVGVQCKIEDTRDDVANQVRDEIGIYSQCRVFITHLRIEEGLCRDSSIADEWTEQYTEYIRDVTPVLELVLTGLEYEVDGVELEIAYPCKRPILLIMIYKVDTLLELGDMINSTISTLTMNGQLKKRVEILTILYNNVDFDKCKDPPTIRSEMTHCLTQFDDKSYTYQYRTCSAVHDFALCIQKRFVAPCHVEELKFGLFIDKEMVVERLRMYSENSNLTEALKRYDYNDCEDGVDVYPCDDRVKIEDAITKCTANVNLSGFTVNGSVENNFGLNKEICGNYYDIAFCVNQEISQYGVVCRVINHSVYKAVFHFVREKIINGHQLPYNHTSVTSFCADHMPVCTPAYIHLAITRNCSIPYFSDNMFQNSSEITDTCSSYEAMDAFRELVTCIRLQALAREENDCMATTIADIINDDPFKLGLFQKDTDLHYCIGDGADRLDGAVQNKSMVCHTSASLGYFASACSRRSNLTHCSTDVQPGDNLFMCSKYFLIASCVESMTLDMTFYCSLDNIMAVDMPGTMLELDTSELNQCKSLVTYEFRMCQYQIFERKEWFQHCYSALHKLSTSASTVEKCSMFYVSFNCFKEKINLKSAEFSCNSESLDDTVREMLLDFLQIEAYANSECALDQTRSYPDMFSQCTAPPEPVDVCKEDAVYLVTVILTSCTDRIHKEIQDALNNSKFYNIADENVRMCGLYNKLVTCGVNTTNNLFHWCSYEQVDNALKSEADRVSQQFSSPVLVQIDPEICQSNCYMGTPEVKECLRRDIMENFHLTYNDSLDICRYRGKDYYWHCIKRQLPGCDDSAVTAHVDFAMMNISWFPSHCDDFKPSAEGPNMCYNYTDLGLAAYPVCNDHVWSIHVGWHRNQTCNQSAYTSLRECVGKILDLYSYDCYDREPAIDKGILTMTHKLQKEETVHRCFFDSTSGYCPIRDGMQRHSGCSDYEYELCLSDGECKDDENKCCFDGCGHSCIEPAMEPALWLLGFEFIYEDWKEEYKWMNISETIELLGRYQIRTLLKDFGPAQRIELREHSDGAMRLDIWIYSWYNPVYQLRSVFGDFESIGLMLNYVHFEGQDYTRGKPDQCPDYLECSVYYDECSSSSDCGGSSSCCNNTCGYMQCESIDSCSDVTKIVEAAQTCAQGQLQDRNVSLAKWEICRGVDMLVNCIQQELNKRWYSYCSIDQLRNKTEQHKYTIAMKLEESDFGQWTQVTYAIRNFDYHVCQSNYFSDIYPCDSWKLKEDAWNECRWTIDDMLIHLTSDQMNNYNVTPENCRQFYNVSSCVMSKIRGSDARCTVYDSEAFVYNKTRQEIPNGHVLPEDMQVLDFCYEYLPVCTSLYLLEDNECKHNSLYYMDDMDCHSENFTAEFSYYLICLRLKAFAHEEEKDTCTINKIIDIIAEDPFNLDILSSNITDIRSCFGADRISALESSLSSPEDVCYNPDVLSHFAYKCVRMGADRCEVDWSELVNKFSQDVVCTVYFRYIECIRKGVNSLTPMGYQCNTGAITKAAIPQLNLSDTAKAHCTDKLDKVADFRECDYSLINDEELERCYGGLRYIQNMSFAFDTARSCSVYGESVRCLNDTFRCRPDGSVTPSGALLLHMLSASEIIWGNQTCMDMDYVTNYYSYFEFCDPGTAAGDLCTNLPALRDVTLLHCSSHIKDKMMMFYSSRYNQSDSAISVAPCRFLDELVMCGHNTSSRLGSDCTSEQVLDSLTATPGAVMQETMIPFTSGIDPLVCTGPCYQMTDDVRNCMNHEAVYHFYTQYMYNDTVRCRAYDYMWHCVNKKLNYGKCDSNIIDEHLTFTLREAAGPYSTWRCQKPSADVPDMCMDYEAMSYVGPVACYDLIKVLYQGFTDQYGACINREETITCLSEIIDTYSAGCSWTEKESTITRAVILAARRNNFNIEHCFDHKDGYCPYVDMKNRYCYGDEPNTCLMDADCTDSKRCCADGCASGCSDIATQPAEFLILLQIRNEVYYYTLYSDFNNPMAQGLIRRYKDKLDDFMILERYEIVGINEWNGMAAFELKAWSYTDPHILLSSNYTYTEDFNVIFINYTSGPGDKDGACPSVFDSNRNYAYYNWCQHDRDCSYDHKCCPNRNNYYVCAPPGPDLPDCEDLGQLMVAASACGVSVFTLAQDLQGYTCKMLIEKFKCFMETLNKDRPLFYECSGTALKKRLLEMLGQNISTSFDIYMCSEWEVTLSYYDKSCEYGSVPVKVEEHVKNNVLPVLLDGFDYDYKGASCGGMNFKCGIASDQSDYQLQNHFNDVLRSSEIFKGENASVYIKAKPLEVDHCTNLPTLKKLGAECVKNNSYYYDDWQICSPIYRLAECISSKVNSFTSNWCGYEPIVTTLFKNEVEQQKFLSELWLELGLAIPEQQRKWLAAISHYSKEACPKGDNDIYPCDDYETKMGIYNRCKNQTMTNPLDINSRLSNYGISPDNCRDFFKLASCALSELHKLRVDCWGVEQFVYDRLKEEFDPKKELPGTFTDLDFCEAYQPVCSSLFIRDSSRSRCQSTQPYNYGRPHCTSDRDMVIVKSFVTCVRLLALSKYQVECTPLKIKEIIKDDYFKLYIIEKSADIDMCIPDDSIANILPTRASVCTSGIPVTLYEHHCTQYNNLTSYNGSSYNGTSYNGTSSNTTTSSSSSGTTDSSVSDATASSESWPSWGCETTARGLAEAGAVDLGCMLYLTEMSCVQVLLTTNMSFDCTLDQLANSPVPDTSSFYLPDYRAECLATYNSEKYQSCDASLSKSPVALSCSAVLINSTFMTLQDDEEQLCNVYQETLACYDGFAKQEGLNCTADQLHNFQLHATALAEHARRQECDSSPENSPYDICPAVIPQDDLCKSTDRLANLVVGVCAGLNYYMPKFNSTDQIDENVLNCKLLQSVVWCGTNVTRLLGWNCTQDLVKSALYARADLVSARMPDLDDISVCQDSCYNTEEAVNECVRPYAWIWNMDSCRIFTYMWQCLNSRMRQNNGNYCSGTIINSTIAVNLPRAKTYLIFCPDPREHPLDICSNATELAFLGGYNCANYLYNMSRLGCENGDLARECYQNMISTFVGYCYDQEKVVEKAMVLAGYLNGYNVKPCVVENFRRDGFCPFTYSSYCGGRELNTDECVLDTGCGDTNKCCYTDCKSTCRAALAEPARWSVKITFKNETFVSGMKERSSTAYQQFMDRYSAFFSVLCGLFHHCEAGDLSSGSVVWHYFIWSPVNPYDILTNAMRMHFGADLIHIEIGYPSRSEAERPGQCPTYPDGIDNVCGLDTCDYDADCAVGMAKCCWTNCYNQSYNSRRCIDLATPTTTFKYYLVFRPQYGPGRPIYWQEEFMNFNSNESKSLVHRYDYMFQQMFINYFVLNLRRNGSTVDLIMNAWSYKDYDSLKEHIYMKNNGTLELLNIAYEDRPPEGNCSDHLHSIGYKCSDEIWYFLYETDSEKKCTAYKTFVDCMGTGNNCNKTQMRNYLRANIHGIGKSWLANSTVGLNTPVAQHLYDFDAYKCDGDVGPDKDCYDHINVTFCLNDLRDVLHEQLLNLKCLNLNNLMSCVQNYVSDYCESWQVEDFLRRNIHSIGAAYYGNNIGAMAPPEIDNLRHFDPYMCDIILNSVCPKVLARTYGTCAEECGRYANQSQCEEGFSCCPNECGAHVCRPDMSVCSSIYKLLPAMKDNAAPCLYGISLDESDFCESFWTGVSCLATSLVGEAFRDQCIGMMKQVLTMYAEGMFSQGVSDMINMPVSFPVHPMLCTGDGDSVCDDASMVYHVIIGRNCSIWMSRLAEQHEKQEQCMAFESLVKCVSTSAGFCNKDKLRMLLYRNIRYMAYRFSQFQSPFYGDLPSLPGSVTPLDPTFLSQFMPEKCSDVLMNEPPKIFTENEKIIYFRPEESAMIPCAATGHPTPQYRWKKNGMDYYHPQMNVFVGTLLFNSAQSSDEGIYQCFADNGYGVSMSVKVIFLEAYLGSFSPSVPETVICDEGHHCKIYCMPPVSSPHADIHWMYKDGDDNIQTVKYGNRITQDHEGSLQFLNVEMTDVKTYFCTAKNNILQKSVNSSDYHLDVRSSANVLVAAQRVWSSPSDIFALEGKTVKMMCIFGGNPTPRVQWMKDVSPLDTGMELQIDNVQLSHAGNYECTGSNYVNGQQYSEYTSISLRVESVPQFVQPMEDVVTSPGETAVFTCIAEGIPEPEYHWYINGVPLEDVEDVRYYMNPRAQLSNQTTFSLSSVTLYDHMNIQCNATNRHGYAFRDVFLNVIEPAMMCPDLGQIKMNHLPKCEDIISQMWVAYDNQEKCRLFEDLVDCLVKDMSYDDLHCDDEELKGKLSDPATFKDWSKGMDWSYNDSCAEDSSCKDSTSIMSMATGSCYPELVAAQSYTSNSPESCGTFLKLFKCVNNNMKAISWYCERDSLMETLIGDDHIFRGFDIQYCNLKCSGDFVEKAKNEECRIPFSRMMTTSVYTERCRHFSGFLGCIKFHALLNHEDCDVRDLETIAQKKMFGQKISICQTCDYHWTVYNDSQIAVGEVNIGLDNHELTEKNATITLKAYHFDPLVEWMGFGISYDTNMPKSDIVTAQKTYGGYQSWKVTDRYADGKFRPSPDLRQDINRVSGHMEGETAVVEFSRKVNTSDSSDIVLDFDRYLLFARGRLDENGDIGSHSFKKASEYFIFQCFPYDSFENMFPDYKEEFCLSPVIQRHLWEYNCLTFNPSVITDQDVRCRSEISRRGCVLEIFEEANVGCTMDNVIEVSQMPEVRKGLLDSVEPGCESKLKDTPCEQQVYREGLSVEHCYTNIFEFFYLTTSRSVDDINAMMSADGITSLKCSLFEETLKCILTNMPSPKDMYGNIITCSPADIAETLNSSLHGAYEVISSMYYRGSAMMDDAMFPAMTDIPYGDCINTMSSEVPQKQCPELSDIADMIVGRCGSTVIGTVMDAAAAPPGGGSCSSYEGFKRCVSEMYLPNRELCPDDHVQNAIEEYSWYISQQLGGFDPVQCAGGGGEKCSSQFMEKARNEECVAPFTKLTSGADNCRHYQGFLRCVKFHALKNNEVCHVSKLDEIGKELSIGPGYKCFDYDDFEATFPATRSEICKSSMVVRELLYYNCITYDYTVLTEPLDRCSLELNFRGCVYFIIGGDVGCTPDDVEQVMRRDDVRDGLLDGISLSYCDANLHLEYSECELAFFSNADPSMQQCYMPLFSLPFLNTITEVDQLQSSTEGGGKLKCSLYTEALRCVLTRAHFDDCSPRDFVKAIKNSIRVYAQITLSVLKQTSPGLVTDPSKMSSNLTECEADLPDELPDWTCSSTNQIADAVVGQCGTSVLLGIRLYGLELCMNFAGFEACLSTIAVHADCPEDYVWTSVDEHQQFIATAMDGFNPVNCKYVQSCSDLLQNATLNSDSSSPETVVSKCFGSLNMPVYTESVTMDEKCSVFHILRPGVEACLSDNLPDYCDKVTSTLWDQRMTIYSYTNFIYKDCPDTEPDVCNMFGIVGYSKCYNEYTSGSYSTNHCRLRSCFQKEAPSECNFNETQIETFASEAFSKFVYGLSLPECTDTQQCMVHLEDSGDSEHCYSPLPSFLMLNEAKALYPGGNFNYSREEGCGVLKVVSECLKMSFPNDETCQNTTWGMVENYLTYEGIMYNMDFYTFMCQAEEDIDQCLSNELFVGLQCHKLLPYSCNFEMCAETSLEKFSNCPKIPPTPESIYQRYTGNNFACYGLNASCEYDGCAGIMNSTCIDNYCQCDEYSHEENGICIIN